MIRRILSVSNTRNVRLHIIAFAIVVTLTIYIIFNLDYPRFGLIQLEFTDKALLDLVAGMK